MGAPSSGKSTLASDVHTELKKRGFNSIFIPEAATDYIAECGVPNEPLDQIVIFYKQLNREKMYIGTKDYIICDSSSLLAYFYFRTLFTKNLTNKEISTINHIQKEILQSLSQWSQIFYVPNMPNYNKDGIRTQTEFEAKKIDRWIKSYLELENIPHLDLSEVQLDDRTNYIIDILTKK